MKAKSIGIVVAIVATSFGLARTTSALTYVCELHGDAQFDPGLSASTTPLDVLDFAFQGDLENCKGDSGEAQTLCAVGKLNAPSCLGNQTDGQEFVICAGPCTSTPGGTPTCDGGATPLIHSSFSGACAGAICAGNNALDRAAYVVAFDQATINAAFAACNPVTPGDPVMSAHFDGFEIRLNP